MRQGLYSSGPSRIEGLASIQPASAASRANGASSQPALLSEVTLAMHVRGRTGCRASTWRDGNCSDESTPMFEARGLRHGLDLPTMPGA